MPGPGRAGWASRSRGRVRGNERASRGPAGLTSRMLLPFALLAAAMLALWIPGHGAIGRWLWAGLALGALGTAMITGTVRPIGALGGAVWFGALVAWKETTRPVGRGLLAVILLALAAALMLHRVPGFANPRVIEAVRFTPDAIPFTLHLNFDKTLIGLGLLALVLPRIREAREWGLVLRQTWGRTVAVMAVVLVASLAAGYVRWAPKFPRETWWWAGVNLLFVCTAEEALFRGFIQGGLRRAWAAWHGGNWLALTVAAVAFGLAHLAGGWTYVALGTLAGAGYGWIYERTQRIEASVLAHFGLNAVHFLLFTYPALAMTT